MENSFHQFELLGLTGEFAGQRIPLTEKPVVIGQDPKQASLIMSNRQVSRRHCQISIINGAVYLRDFTSRNGTWLNNQRVQVATPLPVHDGDQISVAGTDVFRVVAAQPTVLTPEVAVSVPQTSPQQQTPIIQIQVNAPQPSMYAGFWLRVGAVLIDGVLVTLIGYGLGFLLGLGIVALLGALHVEEDTVIASIGVGLIGWIVVFSIGPLLYFVIMESSRRQATFGKIAMGIYVTDMQGNRISFWRALARNLSKFLSGLVLSIGYLMAAFTEKKQSLHDLIANCLVVRGKASR